MRRVEKKLYQSLTVITPKRERAKKHPTFEYGYLLGTLLVAVTCYFLLTPTFYYNEQNEPIARGIHVLSQEQEEVQLDQFPWQESTHLDYQYQQAEGVLSITWTEAEDHYLLTLQKENLMVESTDKETVIQKQKVYLYQNGNNLKAKWQHEDYTVILEGTVSKTHFSNKLKQIIKENLK